MIYLIKTVYYIEETGVVLKLLKIGFTGDNESTINSRFLAYKLHNPLSEVLFKIPGGTEDHEKRIQYKFRNLLYSDYGREWFYYSDEIIDFFSNIDSLDGLEEELSKDASGRYYDRFRKKVKEVVESVYPINFDEVKDYSTVKKTLQGYCEELVDNLGDKISNEENILSYLRKDLGDSVVDDYISKKANSSYSEEIMKFLEEYKSQPTLYEKLKTLCEYGLSKENLEIVLDQILPKNSEIKYYYITLGPDNLKRLGYNSTNIKRELGIITFNPLVLQHYIFLDFKEGDRLTVVDIKDKLKKIYTEINYEKTPKATDILNYFEVKEISIYEKNSDGSRRRIRGYELLSKKELE